MARWLNTAITRVARLIAVLMSCWVTRTMLLVLGLWSAPPQPNAVSIRRSNKSLNRMPLRGAGQLCRYA